MLDLLLFTVTVDHLAVAFVFYSENENPELVAADRRKPFNCMRYLAVFLPKTMSLSYTQNFSTCGMIVFITEDS